MPKFSKLSEERLASCAMPLQELMRFVILHRDITILEGFRGEEAQEEAFSKGNSKLRWPNSKHNTFPSRAVDVAPYPVDWQDVHRFRELGHYIQGVADVLGIHIKWGGDWNWKDYPHFELADQPEDIV